MRQSAHRVEDRHVLYLVGALDVLLEDLLDDSLHIGALVLLGVALDCFGEATARLAATSHAGDCLDGLLVVIEAPDMLEALLAMVYMQADPFYWEPF